MSVRLKPYPEYKDSGLGWLGRIPAHWDLRRMKFLLSELDARSAEGKEQLLRVSQYSGITERKSQDGSQEPDTRAKSLVGYKRVEPNDLVINIMLAWNGSLGVSRYTGIVSPAYCVYRFRRDAVPKYYDEMLRLPIYKGRIKVASTGVVESRLRLYSDDLGCIEGLLPPPDEQASIARFVEAFDRKTNALIRAKRRLIELLNEQKQAIIQRAVMRGLDPAVPLKPSGIPWLGDIPAHWEAVQLRRLVSLVTSGSRGWAQYYSDSGDVFLQSGNLGRAMALNLSFIQHVRTPEGAEGARTKVKRDDVLVCITGALTGNVVVVDVDLPAAYVNQHVALVRPKPGKVNPRFLAYILHSRIGQAQFKTSEYGGTKQGLGLGDVKSVFVPFPSRDEQTKIVEELDRRVAELSRPIADALREIDLIREFRTRLIADVVTGQLDVRGVAVPEIAAESSEDTLDDPEMIEAGADDTEAKD